jgi:hypothetical protein
VISGALASRSDRDHYLAHVIGLTEAFDGPGCVAQRVGSIDHGSQALRLEQVVDVWEIAVGLQSDDVKTLVAAPGDERGQGEKLRQAWQAPANGDIPASGASERRYLKGERLVLVSRIRS